MGAKGNRQRFAYEYIIDRNGAAAARRCGYSPTCAKQRAVLLLNDPLIRQQIDDLEAEIQARCKMSAEMLIATTHRIALDPSERTSDRLRALEMLLKVKGEIVEKHEHSGPNGAPMALRLTGAERRKRLEEIMGNVAARHAAATSNGNGHTNGNGSHA